MGTGAFRIGDIGLSRAYELTLRLPTGYFFPDTTAEDWAPHAGWLAAEGAYEPGAPEPAGEKAGEEVGGERATAGSADRPGDGGRILLPVQSYVVTTSHHTIVVDTCMGNHKNLPDTPWGGKDDSVYLDNLAALGLGVEDVDLVLCTHLHLDHVGWNTRLVDGRWEPTFPNARYLLARTEYEAAVAGELASDGSAPAGMGGATGAGSSDASSDGAGASSRTVAPEILDSVVPVVEAGRADLVEGDHVIDDEVRLEPTPGHTPGHVAVRLTSGGARAVIGGDLMHSPVQCRHPEWRSRPDWDPDLARRTRRSFLEEHADTDTRVVMAHFPHPSAGRVVAEGDAFRFVYDDADW